MSRVSASQRGLDLGRWRQGTAVALKRAPTSGAAQDDEGYLRGNAQANWGTDGAQASIDVEARGLRLRICCEDIGGSTHQDFFGRLVQRPLEQAGDIVGDESRGRETVIENFHLDLAAVRVAGERQLDAEFRGAVETVGIVGKENVRDIAPDQRIHIRQQLHAPAVDAAFALVVHAYQIELRATERELRVFVAQEFHSTLGKELLRGTFRFGVNLVIAVATPNAQWRMQEADFLDAIRDRICRASDEVSSDHRKIGAQIVGHIHGATDVGAAHVAA
jgi:hypothetical protein